MKMIFNYDANKTHFHNKGFALNLVLRVRFFGTRKWPIVKLLDEVCISHTKQIGDNKTVCTTQEVRKNVAHWLISL